MKAKILSAFLLCLIAASCSWGEARTFVEYPTLGESTGEGVRIRSDTNTNSEIIGKLNEYDKIIVLQRVKAGNDAWYEVDNPLGERKAYVSAKYLAPAYRQEFQRSKGAKLLTEIRLAYGTTAEKMMALSGRPEKLTRNDNDGIPLITLDWGDYRALYWATLEDRTGYLKSLEVKSGSRPFGNLRIGDSTEKLRSELGSPTNENASLWEYEFYLYGYDYGTVDELVDMCIFRFTIEDGKISRMYYYNHENGEDGEEKW